MTFHTQILTLYPDMFPGPLGTSLAGRALMNCKRSLNRVGIGLLAGPEVGTLEGGA